jgi:hypothetical protein
VIDLHIHTTCSDGTLTPSQVVHHAVELGLQAIAITDHDTVEGTAPAQEAARTTGIQVVPGVELSLQWRPGILHLLGYFPDTSNAELLSVLNRLTRARTRRIPQIVDRLRAVGVRITSDDVYRCAAGGAPGRPHVAGVLVSRGYVSSLQQAFDQFLKKGRPAYVSKEKLVPEEALEILVRAQGLPVIAHPYSLLEAGISALDGIIRDLKPLGLQGIEAYYPRHSIEQTRLFEDVALRHGLIVSGGTDFHGANKPDIKMGRVAAGPPLPVTILGNLKDRWNEIYAEKNQPLPPTDMPEQREQAGPSEQRA